eukprot:scaffold710_cov171-Amphora_coffeaeformis.AAC.58
MEVDHQEFFIVQKCWFDGPHIEPPVDYLALFATQSQAEETAYHAAHFHANQRQAVVRTLLLPTGYAFSAAGKLFWVRRVYARGQSDMIGRSSGAHVILTKGVIGGTGNSNSRRGAEVAHNRVFLGHDSATQAMQVFQQESLPPETVVTFVPMGPLANVMDGWSAGGASVTNHNQTNVLTDDMTTKRSSMDGQPQQQFHYHVTSARPAKRHCVFVPNTLAAESATADVSMSI